MPFLLLHTCQWLICYIMFSMFESQSICNGWFYKSNQAPTVHNTDRSIVHSSPSLVSESVCIYFIQRRPLLSKYTLTCHDIWLFIFAIRRENDRITCLAAHRNNQKYTRTHMHAHQHTLHTDRCTEQNNYLKIDCMLAVHSKHTLNWAQATPHPPCLWCQYVSLYTTCVNQPRIKAVSCFAKQCELRKHIMFIECVCDCEFQVSHKGSSLSLYTCSEKGINTVHSLS